MALCASYIDEQLKELSLPLAQIAQWDDMYEFAKSKDQQFIDANFVDSVWESLNINICYVVDASKKVLFSKGYDLVKRRSLPLPTSLFPPEGLPATSPLLVGTDSKVKSGLLRTHGNPLLVVSSAILRSDGTGPSRGTFILGRWLNDELFEEIAARLDVNLTAKDVSELSETEQEILLRVKTEGPIVLDDTSRQLRLYTIYPDIEGEPAILLVLNL